MAPPAMDGPTAESRSTLPTRVLPKMTLSTGGPDSLTAPPPRPSSHLSAAERAAARFSVQGNAISMI